MHRFTNVLVALSLAVGLAACGGGYSGFVIPVETELKPWVAPEADELVANDDEEDEDDGDNYEDYVDEEDSTPAATPAATPKPTPAPAVTK